MSSPSGFVEKVGGVESDICWKVGCDRESWADERPGDHGSWPGQVPGLSLFVCKRGDGGTQGDKDLLNQRPTAEPT